MLHTSKLSPKDKKIIGILLVLIIALLALTQRVTSPLSLAEKRLEKLTKRKQTKISIKSKVRLMSQGKVASQFSTLMPLDIPAQHKSKVESIIWGNKDFGYFKSDYSGQKNLDFVPFTYKSKINFCYQMRGGSLVTMGARQFKAPRPALLKNIKTDVLGEFQQNFFLLGAQYIPDDDNVFARSFFPMIVNKWGEVVWAHLPQNGKQHFRKYPVIRKVAPGEYGILFGEKASFFEHFNYKGEVLNWVNPRVGASPYVIHHDFKFIDKQKIISLGHKRHFVRNTLAFTEANVPWWSLFSAPLSYLSTTVDLVDLETNSRKILWDPVTFFSPVLEGTKWATGKKQALKKVLSPPRHFYQWGESALIDFTHANSIEYYSGKGFLVSLRNLSKLVFLDEKFEKVLWTAGNESSDTFQTSSSKEGFYHQHNAQLLPSGYLLLMDNHVSPPAKNNIGSRVVVYGFDNQQKKLKLAWSYQPPSRYKINNRGSAYLLKNENILAFYPASVGLKDHLIEIDRTKVSAIAHMQIYFSDVKRSYSDKQLKKIEQRGLKPILKVQEGGGNRGTPVYTLGMEKVEAKYECPL
ncbi:MAG: hypothetical protein HOO06_06455 [Bdellovibrionaceae bacterium]|jgi:hypothetical protein|nr:hypothetical protein [Pseudobdellovibrionaceae bacterium]